MASPSPPKMLPFQSTLSMRRAIVREAGGAAVGISIHALHEESENTKESMCSTSEFQSTLSMRRATAILRNESLRPSFQSTLSMRRAIDIAIRFEGNRIFQSTLSMRRAITAPCAPLTIRSFQSTLSMRRATLKQWPTPPQQPFQSTLSMRTSDRTVPVRARCRSYFNPRSPSRRAIGRAALRSW